MTRGCGPSARPGRAAPTPILGVAPRLDLGCLSAAGPLLLSMSWWSGPSFWRGAGAAPCVGGDARGGWMPGRRPRAVRSAPALRRAAAASVVPQPRPCGRRGCGGRALSGEDRCPPLVDAPTGLIRPWRLCRVGPCSRVRVVGSRVWDRGKPLAFGGHGEAVSIFLESVPFLEASSRTPSASFFHTPAWGESPSPPRGRRRRVNVVPFLEVSPEVCGGVDGAFLLGEGTVAASCAMFFVFSARSSSFVGALQLAYGWVAAQVVVRSCDPSRGGAMLPHSRAARRHCPFGSMVSTLHSDGSAPFEPGQDDSGLLRR